MWELREIFFSLSLITNVTICPVFITVIIIIIITVGLSRILDLIKKKKLFLFPEDFPDKDVAKHQRLRLHV